MNVWANDDEFLLVLSGTLTLRTPQGMRELVSSTRVSDDATVYPEA